MEKQRKNSSKKSCRRLLKKILPVFLFLNFISPAFSAEYVAVADDSFNDNNVYANENVKFSFVIKNVSSRNVDYNFSALKADYQKNEKSEKQKILIPFKVYRKSEILNSTRIEFMVEFEQDGFYTFEPEEFFINGKKNKFEIQPVHVVLNPDKIEPRLVIDFYKQSELYYSDSTIPDIQAEAFKDLYFSVGIQYAKEYSNFSYELPDNSLFEQTKSHDVKTFPSVDDKIILIADFKWKALADEKMEFPKMSVTAVKKNGMSVDLKFPRFSIDFLPPSISSESLKKSDLNTQSAASAFEKKYLDNAFFSEDAEEAKLKIFSKEECIKLAEDLRAEKTNYFPALIVSLVLFLLFIIVQFFIKARPRKMKIFFGILSFASLIFCGFFKSKNSEVYGVFAGGIVYSVPDENSSSLLEIEGGKKIRILKTGEQWSKVRFDNIEGWIPSEMVVRI